MLERSFRIGSIPVRALALDDSTERAVVLFYHGLHSSKETHASELDSLARRGFLALGVDFQGHGERAIPDLSNYLKLAPWPDQAFKLLIPTLEEIPLLVDVLQGEGYRRFAVMGISLGGILAFGVPLVEARIEAVVAILGCPQWGLFPGGERSLARSPHRFPEAFGAVSLLAWNGGQDEHIVTSATRAFMEQVPGPHEDREYPESGHFMRPEDWRDGWDYSLEFLSQRLG